MLCFHAWSHGKTALKHGLCIKFVIVLSALLLLRLWIWQGKLDTKSFRSQIQQSKIYYDGSVARWDKRLIDQASDVPSIIFFLNFLQNSLKKSFQFIFLFFKNFMKIKIMGFDCLKSIRNYEKKNAWNIRCLVDEAFVPETQRASVLYWRLLDFTRLLDNTF